MISVNRTNRAARLELVAVLAVEAALVAALHWAGSGAYAVPLGELRDWLVTSDPTVVLVAVARLAGLAIAYWLLTTTVLYAASYHLGLDAVTRALHWVTLPVVRHMVQGVTAMSLTGVSLLGPSAVSAVPAWAQQVVSAQDAPETTDDGDEVTPDTGSYAPGAAGWPSPSPGDTSGFWLPAGPGGQAPTGPAGPVGPSASGETSGDYVVMSGDHFWKIAENRLRQATGRDVTDDEVAQYWVRVVDANRAAIRSGDPDLIYPLERVTLPQVFE